jgi:hypothetical protein
MRNRWVLTASGLFIAGLLGAAWIVLARPKSAGPAPGDPALVLMPRPGRTLLASSVACAGGARRSVGGSGTQLVVLASPGDCTLKRGHLDAIAEFARDTTLKLTSWIATEVTEESRNDAVRLFKAVLPTLPLCWDSAGTIRRALAVRLGPESVLLHNGRVVWRASGDELQNATQIRTALRTLKTYAP